MKKPIVVSYQSMVKKKIAKTSQNYSPALSNSNPEFAIQQRRISGVSCVMRNRKSRETVVQDDNSQDAMIKMVDLANYIHDPKV